MIRITFLVILVVSLSSCVRKEDNKVIPKYEVKKGYDENVYLSLKTHIEYFKSNHVSIDMIDSVMKYYALNEINIDKGDCKIFPNNTEDDKLYYTFLDSIQNLKIDNYNKYSILIKLDLITLSNAEWGEGLSEIIESYWYKPTLLFVKAVAELPDSQIVRINDTYPEERDSLLLIIKRIENIPNIRQAGNYKKVIKHLRENASHQR